MRKSAQTFLRRAPVATHAMHRAGRRRDVAHRATATRPALTSSPRHNAGDHLAHLHAMPPPTASRGYIDRHGSHRSPAGAGTHRYGALHRTAPCAASENRRRRACASNASDTATRQPRCARSAVQRQPHTVFASTHAATSATRVAATAMPRRATPMRTAVAAAWRPKRNRPHEAAGSGVATGRSAQWPSSSSSSAYSSGDSSSFNCSASSASSTRIQPSP